MTHFFNVRPTRFTYSHPIVIKTKLLNNDSLGPIHLSLPFKSLLIYFRLKLNIAKLVWTSQAREEVGAWKMDAEKEMWSVDIRI